MSRKLVFVLTIVAFLITSCAAASDFGGSVGGPIPESAEMLMAEPAGGNFARTASVADNVGQTVERLVIKNANLSIVVKEPGEVMSDIAQMAEEMGGFVVSSNLFQTTLDSGVEVPRASITIRVPADKLTEAIGQIETNANRVLSKNDSGEDVTEDYTDLQSRLRNLEDAEAQLREIMASATKTEDVMSVFDRLTQVREQIEVLKGRIQFYEQSAAFSAISVDILADEAVQPLTIGGWQPVGVAKDALQFLITGLKFLANVAIWLVLAIIPILAVIAVPLVLIGRGLRRRRSRRRQTKPAAYPRDESSDTET
jgi:hypothetical protein